MSLLYISFIITFILLYHIFSRFRYKSDNEHNAEYSSSPKICCICHNILTVTYTEPDIKYILHRILKHMHTIFESHIYSKLINHDAHDTSFENIITKNILDTLPQQTFDILYYESKSDNHIYTTIRDTIYPIITDIIHDTKDSSIISILNNAIEKYHHELSSFLKSLYEEINYIPNSSNDKLFFANSQFVTRVIQLYIKSLLYYSEEDIYNSLHQYMQSQNQTSHTNYSYIYHIMYNIINSLSYPLRSYITSHEQYLSVILTNIIQQYDIYKREREILSKCISISLSPSDDEENKGNKPDLFAKNLFEVFNSDTLDTFIKENY